MIQGFKEFISKGNVIDLAVAVVIGGAFGAIVTAFVDSIINPLIGVFVPSGSLDGWTIPIPGIFGTAQLGIGGLIMAIINFLVIALVVYAVLVYPMNRLRERQAAKLAAKSAPAGDAAPAPTTEELLAQIRDLLANQQAK